MTVTEETTIAVEVETEMVRTSISIVFCFLTFGILLCLINLCGA